MNTQIKLTYEGETFILEFNRMTVKLLEENGFVLNEFLSKPMSNIELVFAAAFVKNHPNVSQQTINNIFKGCKDKNILITNLNIMITETYDSLLSDPDEDDSGNVTWEIVDLKPKKKEKSQA